MSPGVRSGLLASETHQREPADNRRGAREGMDPDRKPPLEGGRHRPHQGDHRGEQAEDEEERGGQPAHPPAALRPDQDAVVHRPGGPLGERGDAAEPGGTHPRPGLREPLEERRPTALTLRQVETDLEHPGTVDLDVAGASHRDEGPGKAEARRAWHDRLGSAPGVRIEAVADH